MGRVAELFARCPRAAVAAVVSGALLVPGVALAASHPSVRQGYYATLVGVTSADVELHVRAHAKIPDLVFDCVPATPIPGSYSVGIAVHAPALTLSRSGRFSYNGPAEVSEAFAGAKDVGTTTLSISGYHVSGPVHHYVFERRHLQQTTAFKGVASSPACVPPSGQKFTLFGPVPGE